MKHGSWDRSPAREEELTLQESRMSLRGRSVIVNNNPENHATFFSSAGIVDRTRSKMEIYSNASTARINFRLSSTYELASPRSGSRSTALQSAPPLLLPWIFAPLSANDLQQRRWHQGLSPIRTVPTSRSSLSFFLLISFHFSSPDAFYSRPECDSARDFSEL